MSESLVTRQPDTQAGRPCLRGTRFPVHAVQQGITYGGMAFVRGQYPALNDWTDEQLLVITTYPRLEDFIPGFDRDSAVDMQVDDDGSFSVDGWFRPEGAPELIAAIQRATGAIVAWKAACDEWERTSGLRTHDARRGERTDGGW